ncbi:TetR/AcrR family transcriptional regulator [Paenibacillus sp. MMS18-CY102]|uniref:TetR/AcrR family transcriptional regulator n=1 Tax=Paenibacillus sp. MMS18-CY102 TaxID=2682849 RepID=UPI0013664D0A|nr:TetR/AcrR family transcriptional regulator [Paenibacillus sp. MMS18-CY102]MWC29379.1 TetR family transcriptional regulator [Paenibacillus sp. MMS18-CY102]
MNRNEASDNIATKQRIVDTAKGLFAQKGYGATSIQSICEEVGCSKGAIYHHFKNKEELFVYIAEQTFTVSWDQWLVIAAQHRTMVEKLYAFADYFVDTMQRPLSKAAEEFLKSAAGDETRMKFIGLVTGYMQHFETFITEGVNAGELKQEDPKELAFMVLSFYSGLGDSYAFLPKEAMKPLFRKATTLLLDGIRP